MKARRGDDRTLRPEAISGHILSEYLGIVILSELEPFALMTPSFGGPLANAEVV